METSLIGLNADEILMRAELLLHDVSSLVLKNVPEVSEVDQSIDDEEVRALLKLGGSPPAQLILPSVYAANQRVLERLSSASILRIQFKRILILSTRYGIRKEGTYLLIHPPVGCIRPANQPQAIRIPLIELQDKFHEASKILRKNNKLDSLRNFFVGNMDLDKSIDFELDISDYIMKEWLDGSSLGCIKVELFGYLCPANTISRGELSSAVRMAYSIIPLSALLGTNNLETEILCNLEVDISSHSLVQSRMINISFGQRSKQSTPLGAQMGTISINISVHEDSNKISHKNNTIPKIPEACSSESKDNSIHKALNYIPEERGLSHLTETSQPLSGSRFIELSHQSKVPIVFALAFCALEDFSLPIEKLIEIAQQQEQHCDAIPKLSLQYKLSSSEKECVEMGTPVQLRGEMDISIDALRLHSMINPNTWLPPVVEVWLSWLSTQLADETGEERVRESRTLLGLVRFPRGYKPGSTVQLPVMDIARGVQRGTLSVACVVGMEAEAVETSAHCVLNAFHIQRRSQPPRRSVSNTATATVSNTHSQHHERTASIETEKSPTAAIIITATEQKSTEDGAVSTDIADAKQEVQIPTEETKKQCDEMDNNSVEATTGHTEDQHEEEGEADLSIAEICDLLNSSEEEARTTAPVPTLAPVVTRGIFSEERQNIHDMTSTVSETLPTNKSNKVLIHSRSPAHSIETIPLSSKILTENASTSTQTIHLLDLSVHGPFTLFHPITELLHRYSIFGCFVQYKLQSFEGTQPSKASLWWDSDCPVVNGTNRHQFTCEHADLKGLQQALGCTEEHICFELYASDGEGNLPMQPVLLGTAELPLQTLSELIREGRGFQQMELSIRVSTSTSWGKELFCSVDSERMVLSLMVSHRIEPVLLRRSGELDSIFSTAASEPPPHQQEQQKQQVEEDVPSNQAVTISEDKPVLNSTPIIENNQSALDGSNKYDERIIPGTADPVSRLLGFEITQEDLDGMLYFRDAALPLPWVPFQDQRPQHSSTTSSINHKHIGMYHENVSVPNSNDNDTSGMSEQNGDFTSLRRVLLELEYIKRLESNSTRGDGDMEVSTLAPPVLVENEPYISTVGVAHTVGSEVKDAVKEEEDNDTECYRSDFESWDGTIESYAEFLGEEKQVSATTTATDSKMRVEDETAINRTLSNSTQSAALMRLQQLEDQDVPAIHDSPSGSLYGDRVDDPEYSREHGREEEDDHSLESLSSQSEADEDEQEDIHAVVEDGEESRGMVSMLSDDERADSEGLDRLPDMEGSQLADLYESHDHLTHADTTFASTVNDTSGNVAGIINTLYDDSNETTGTQYPLQSVQNECNGKEIQDSWVHVSRDLSITKRDTCGEHSDLIESDHSEDESSSGQSTKEQEEATENITERSLSSHQLVHDHIDEAVSSLVDISSMNHSVSSESSSSVAHSAVTISSGVSNVNSDKSGEADPVLSDKQESDSLQQPQPSLPNTSNQNIIPSETITTTDNTQHILAADDTSLVSQEHEDSPNTSKIRNIVDQELDRLLHCNKEAARLLIQDEHQPPPPPNSNTTGTNPPPSSYLQLLREEVGKPGIPSHIMIDQWWEKTSTSATTIKPVLPPQSNQSQSSTSIENIVNINTTEDFRSQLNAMKASLPNGRNIGMRSKFSVDEINRTSNIMKAIYRKATV